MSLTQESSVATEFTAANAQYAAQFTKGDLPMPPGRKVGGRWFAWMHGLIRPGHSVWRRAMSMSSGMPGVGQRTRCGRSPFPRSCSGTREIVVIHHTDCGMLTFSNDDIRTKLGETNGADCWNAAQGVDFLPFGNVEQSVIDDVNAIRNSPLLRKDVPVTGFVYDVTSGRIHQVA